MKGRRAAALVIPSGSGGTSPWNTPPAAPPPNGSTGVTCSSCGQFIAVAPDDHRGPLIELLCRHCTKSDVYHRNALRHYASPQPHKHSARAN